MKGRKRAVVCGVTTQTLSNPPFIRLLAEDDARVIPAGLDVKAPGTVAIFAIGLGVQTLEECTIQIVAGHASIAADPLCGLAERLGAGESDERG